MTKREAAIITIFTGILIGSFSDAHEYAEEIYGHPIFTHQFAEHSLCEKLKELARNDFIAIEVTT